MDFLSNIVRVSFPNYLASLPIPNSLGGWFKLSFHDWISLVPFGVAVAGVTYLTYEKVTSGSCAKKTFPKKENKPTVNLNIDKDNPKIVHTFDIEDIGDKKVFCRCWRSKSFPYCDGSHNQHNASTGDNVGPLIIAKKSN